MSTQDEKSFEKMASIWGLKSEQVITKSKNLYSVKHGMFAGCPIVCKGESCPYLATCMINEDDRVVGGRCPQEAGAIMARYEQWCKHFKIEMDGEFIADSDLVDASLIRDLVENEIQLLRAENKIAIDSDFIQKTISTVDAKGKAYYEDNISAAANYKFQLQEKRYKILNLLNSTRKDKAKEKGQATPSEEALSIFNRLQRKLDETDTLKNV